MNLYGVTRLNPAKITKEIYPQKSLVQDSFLSYYLLAIQTRVLRTVLLTSGAKFPPNILN